LPPQGHFRRLVSRILTTAAAAIVATIALPPAWAQGMPAVTQEAAAKVAAARESGVWKVAKGEQLHRISRHFAADGREARQIAKEIAVLNPHALIFGDPARLVVGAKLKLPERLRLARADSPPSLPAVPASEAPVVSRAAVTPPAKESSGGLPMAAGKAAELPSRSDAPAAARSVAAAAVPAYVDRLIDPSVKDEPESASGAAARDESPGLRSWAVEARADRREINSSDRTSAQAIGFRYAQETMRYGDLTLVGQTSRFDPGTTDFPGRRSQADATLFHDNFALTSDYSLASALGVVRPTLPAWLSTSYRVTLAPPLIQGAGTTLTGAGGDFRLALGQLGRYEGYGIQQFARTSGRVATASAAQRLAPDWLVGAAAVALRGSAATPDHNAFSLAVEHSMAAQGSKVIVQAAASDNGERAAWLDAYVRDGRLNQRFGAFHVDPEFRFGESAPARDTQGLYWRGDYRIAGDYFGGGVEYVQDNLRRDPTRGGNDSLGAFANMTLRLDRSTQMGAGLSYRNEQPRVTGAFERNVSQANASLSHNWALGQSRFDWTSTHSRYVQASGERTQAFNWNQEWPRLGPLTVTTLVGSSDEHLAERRVRRKTASIAARGDLASGLRLDSSFTFVDVDDSAGGDRNYNTSIGLDWNPAPDWLLQLTWYRNRIQPSADNPLAPFLKENVVMLTTRYEGSAGSPYPKTADAAARSGTGSIVGNVFFDENRDGVRQATERGAPNVIVILDERQSTNTNAEGRFVFPLVSAGRHRVRIVVERLPLPWGLDDESPRELTVEIRADARLDIGLTRIGP
jgi:hypothetical protein